MKDIVGREPLFRLQDRALHQGDRVAAVTIADRWLEALPLYRKPTTEKALKRMLDMFLRGLHGQPNPYAGGRGGNFRAPDRTAWEDGAHMRRENYSSTEEEKWQAVRAGGQAVLGNREGEVVVLPADKCNDDAAFSDSNMQALASLDTMRRAGKAAGFDV